MDRPLRDRVDQLARRVRWLDRRRRTLAVIVAFVFFIVVSRELSAMFEAPWPNILLGGATLLFAVGAWWIAEVGFAWLTAVWETEHAQILRDRGLPAARLIVRRQPSHVAEK
jgi:hypothetical protein